MSLPQIFHCDVCGYSFGPVGVEAFDPAQEEQQLFLMCAACRQPLVVRDVPGELRSRCQRCGSTDLQELRRCPSCDSPDARWQPASAGGPPAAGGPPTPPFAGAPQAPTAVDVRYHPMPGCLMVVLAVLSLGTANVIIWLTKRRWPARIDDEGIVLRSGRRVVWGDVERLVHVTSDVQRTVARRIDIVTRKGRISVPYERIANASEVLAIIEAHAPTGSTGST